MRFPVLLGFSLLLGSSAFACANEVDPPIVAAGGSGGGAGSSGAGGSGGLVGFLVACSQNAQCETGLCHSFPSKGMICTKPCGSDDVCEAPSPGCNGMGVCRAP